MATTTDLPQPRGWDGEGWPVWDEDALDLRLSALLDRFGEWGHDLDVGVGAVLYPDNIDLADEFLEVLVALVAREKLRREAVRDVSREEGKWRWLFTLHARLRSAPWYPTDAARLGWPADPAELTAEQIDQVGLWWMARARVGSDASTDEVRAYVREPFEGREPGTG